MWDDTTVRLWDTVTGLQKLSLTGHTDSVNSLAFSPDGVTLTSGSEDVFGDHTIRLWDAATGVHKRTLTGHTDAVRSIAFSPDGSVLASASNDGTVLLWSVNQIHGLEKTAN